MAYNPESMSFDEPDTDMVFVQVCAHLWPFSAVSAIHIDTELPGRSSDHHDLIISGRVPQLQALLCKACAKKVLLNQPWGSVWSRAACWYAARLAHSCTTRRILCHLNISSTAHPYQIVVLRCERLQLADVGQFTMPTAASLTTCHECMVVHPGAASWCQ